MKETLCVSLFLAHELESFLMIISSVSNFRKTSSSASYSACLQIAQASKKAIPVHIPWRIFKGIFSNSKDSKNEAKIKIIKVVN